MKSWQVLKEAADDIGVKALAAQLKLSPAMVYKWCQESQKDDPDASGARNPLDRIAEIVSATGSVAVVNWLCHEANGFFVHSPTPPIGDTETELLKNTQQLVQEFSELLSTVTRSIEDDGQIESREADQIRHKWELLKTNAEGFVVACEAGCYVHSEGGE
jgi:hypothetical protein